MTNARSTTTIHDDVNVVDVADPKVKPPVEATDVIIDQPLDMSALDVDDVKYVPSSKDEFIRAVKILLDKQDDDDIDLDAMWKSIRKFGDKMSQKKYNVAGTQTEGIIRGVIRRCLNEGNPRSDIEPSHEELDALERRPKWGKGSHESYATFGMKPEDADMLASIRKSAGIDKADADADAEEAEAAERANPKKGKKGTYNTAGEEGVSLDAIAKIIGLSGASGVKNMLYRIEDQVKYFSSLDEAWFKRLMTQLVSAYIEDLIDALSTNEKGQKAGEADPDDVEFLLDLSERPDDVITQPAFRRWAHDFLQDLYKKNKGKAAPKSYSSKRQPSDGRKKK